MYDDFSRQPKGPVNVASHDNSVVLFHTRGLILCMEDLLWLVMVIQLLFIGHILFYR